MADSTPLLLSQSESSNESKQPPPSLDETIEHCIGEFGVAQLFQAILVSFAWVFDAQQTFISVFTDAEPTWHCTSDSCTSASAICRLPQNSWAWDNPNDTSIISEWGLQCASSIIRGLPASSFFMGCLIGGLMLATLADSMLGRKNLLFLSCLVMSFSGSFTIFSNNIWTYSALKFVNGFGRATIGTCALVLSTELVGKRWRSQVGVIGFFCFTLGFLTLPAFAYVNRGSSWRNLYLWTSVPTIFYSISVHFLVRESPRWLFVRGRKDEAVSILKSIATAGSSGILMSFSNLELRKESWNVDTYSAIKILLKKKWACRRLLTVMAVVFGIGLVYYGMPLGLAKFVIQSLPERHIQCLVRATSLIGDILPRRQAEQKGFSPRFHHSNACTAFNISLIYTLELFPTCVRNSAISMARQSLVFGGMFSPVLVAAGSRNRFLSYGIFGMVIGICGLFVICLPETRGKTICDTMDEEEYNSTKIDLPVVG
ncbi:ORGANIC CATION/CARNITINE TRANSPORTER 3 [Salix viminalis]|uniref:ORGANIC CATION/CARNITINE TRANSPORTER 3 n=1 Tax=Salix viminalis TaxID=40686 RepID=A0A9Q0TZM5_SALVM|nr:ORGANIC CATION/CARNITINE TRANSPORTER 3 [Salix viminalis]